MRSQKDFGAFLHSLGGKQRLVVIQSHDRDMIPKSFRFLCRAPGLSDQSIDISPHLGTSVIETKQGIKSCFLQLPLAGHGSSLSQIGHMGCLWEKMLHINWIVRVLI